jgi:hypothetical protein
LIPNNMGRGDRVMFKPNDEADARPGIIIDFLASQVLLESDEHEKYITHFRNVLPLKKGAQQ